MNLAIVHYHLNRGGVARVIESQLRSLDAALDGRENWHAAILFGGRREGWDESLPSQLKSIRLSLHELPGLDYDGVGRNPGIAPADLADEIAQVLAELEFEPHGTILHVHNHALGKNVALPAALTSLAQRGYRLLLQLHDFAEDLRPQNFQRFALRIGGPPSAWHGSLYPQAPHIHYAVLNRRDFGVLRDAGVDPGRVHFLPNPVPSMDGLPSRAAARWRLADRFQIEPDQRFLLYPVRCIRRKNVGEALLYSRLAPPRTVVGLTLPPLNPAEVPIYAAWKQTAGELNLPCCFDVGAPGALSFAENLAAADLMLTTSVAEGFGMVFLEAWLTGNALVGRDLPEITADFRQCDVRLDLLEPRLLVPVAWVGRNDLQNAMANAYHRVLAAYARPEPADCIDQIRAKTAQELVDFGDLDEPLQRRVIEAASLGEENRRRLLDWNPGMERALTITREEASSRVCWNVRKIEAAFSFAPAGRQIAKVYGSLGSAPPKIGSSVPALSFPERILDRFLDFNRFRMIRS